MMLKLAGNNKFCQINDDQSKKNSQNDPIICPVYVSSVKIPTLLSYSICFDHAVYITKDGVAKGIGDNSNHQIWDSLPREMIKQWTNFELQDVYGAKYTPLSVVCGQNYTLYMAQKQEDDKAIQLIYVRQGKNYGLPIFLNTNGLKPKSIYGGLTSAAAINENGSIIIINDLIFSDQNYTPITGKLPENEVSISIVCCDSKFYTLSSNGRLFESEKPFGNEYSFTEVEELQKVKIINISGLGNQCLAVSQSGEVYGKGESKFLGFGDDEKTIEKFTKNKNLKKYVIKAAFAGTEHSLFLTVDGKVLSCGCEDSGALLIEGELKNKIISSPSETIVKENASFCIAGVGISAVFVGCEVPKNCPNKPTQEMNVVVDTSQSRCCILI